MYFVIVCGALGYGYGDMRKAGLFNLLCGYYNARCLFVCF